MNLKSEPENEMQRIIIWKGIFYHSLEHCVVTVTKNKLAVQATIVGHTKEDAYCVKYNIGTNDLFETREAIVDISYNGNDRVISLRKNDSKGWLLNGKAAPDFDDCIDIDISLTPFSNTLPVKRLSFDKVREHQVKVIYIDILEETIKPVFQKYVKLTERLYRFENVPNDFDANIEFDEMGFVKHYPGLFDRVFINNGRAGI